MASITRSIRASSILLRASGVRALARAVQVQPAVSASIHSSSASASQTTTRKLGFAAAAGVGAAAATALALSFSTAIAADAQPALTKEKGWVPFEVSAVEHISHNTAIVRFALPENHKNLGITVAGLIMARIQTGEKDGKPEYAVRPYTPVSEDGHGYFDLVVKGYPTGVLSKHIVNLKPGDKLEFSGPLTKFVYKPNEVPKILMIAGGSGITPMIQVTREIVNNPADKTHVTILYANVTEDDILCRELLESWAQKHPEKLDLHYSLDKPPANWNGFTGFISKEMISKFSNAKDGGKVFVCGPPGMMKHVSGDKAPDKTQGELSGLLKEMGYTEAEVFKY